MSLTVVFRQTALRNLAVSAARTRTCSAIHVARLPYWLISPTRRTRSRGASQACTGCTQAASGTSDEVDDKAATVYIINIGVIPESADGP